MLGTQALSGGSSAITVSTLTPGSHSITASYSGNANNTASASATLTETITQIATVTTLSSSPSVLHAGATLQLTAATSLAAGATADGALTGNVTFQDGSTVLGTVSVNASGMANLAVSGVSVGGHVLTASFAGNTNYAASQATPLSLTVQQTSTQTALSAASSTTLAGTLAAWSVVVTSSTGIPTGQVTFRDGTTVLGAVTLSGTGTAAISTSTLTRGTHAMTATYSGDANYVNSTSAALQQVVQLALPAVTLSGPGTVEAGVSAAFAAALTTPGVTPTGTLSLLDGSASIASDTVTGNGSLAFSTAALSVGTHTLMGSYSGDADNSAATSASVTVVVRQAASATSLVSSANPLMHGSALTLTATVTSDSPNLGGQVNFFDGSALLGNATLGTHGQAVLSVTQLGAGTHRLTAVYGGDTNHAGSTSTMVNEIVLQTTTASVTSSNNPAAGGQSVTFTVFVSGAGSLAPSGTVSLLDNGTVIATISLNSAGGASFRTSTLTVGAHAITLDYPGDATFSGASAQLTQTVIDADTTTTLTGPTSTATFGQATGFTATVTSVGSMATGMVTFADSGKAIGAATLSSGRAVLTLSTLAPGPHTIVAKYAGDGTAGPSSSGPFLLAVKQNTQLTLSANSNPAWTLDSVSFTVTVTNAGAAPVTGVISFTQGGAEVGTAPVDATGHATLSLPAMSANVYEMGASYAGDGANFPSAAAAYSQTVQLRTTTTTVTGSAGNPNNPQQITLIAVVGGQGSVPPGGTVTFSNGSTTLGQAPVGATGVALLTAPFTEASEPITVSYAGDVHYAGSQSTATINAGTVKSAPQFILAVSAPSITIVTRAHSTIQINIASITGFTDTIALGCLGLPHAGTCTFSPSQVALSANGTASASLVVDTGNPLGSGSGSGSAALMNPGRGVYLCWLPIGVLAGLLRRRRGAMLILLVASALAVTGGIAGCDGLSSAATVPGTYTIQVVGTGQGTGVSETQTITLVVTQ